MNKISFILKIALIVTVNLSSLTMVALQPISKLGRPFFSSALKPYLLKPVSSQFRTTNRNLSQGVIQEGQMFESLSRVQNGLSSIRVDVQYLKKAFIKMYILGMDFYINTLLEQDKQDAVLLGLKNLHEKYGIKGLSALSFQTLEKLNYFLSSNKSQYYLTKSIQQIYDEQYTQMQARETNRIAGMLGVSHNNVKFTPQEKAAFFRKFFKQGEIVAIGQEANQQKELLIQNFLNEQALHAQLERSKIIPQDKALVPTGSHKEALENNKSYIIGKLISALILAEALYYIKEKYKENPAEVDEKIASVEYLKNFPQIDQALIVFILKKLNINAEQLQEKNPEEIINFIHAEHKDQFFGLYVLYAQNWFDELSSIASKIYAHMPEDDELKSYEIIKKGLPSLLKICIFNYLAKLGKLDNINLNADELIWHWIDTHKDLESYIKSIENPELVSNQISKWQSKITTKALYYYNYCRYNAQKANDWLEDELCMRYQTSQQAILKKLQDILTATSFMLREVLVGYYPLPKTTKTTETTKNISAFSAIESELIALPDAAELKKRIAGSYLDYVAQKTGIVDKLANKKLFPMGIALTIETAFYEYMKKESNPIMFIFIEDEKKQMYKAVLKDHPYIANILLEHLKENKIHLK